MSETVLLLAIPAFVLTMLLEWLALRRRPEHKGYTLSDSFGSLSMGVGFLVLDAGWRILGLGFLAWVWQFRAFDIEPVWWSWLLLIVLDDLCMYWAHRLGHEVRLFWCAHHNHHSSEHYNLSTALRQSWTEHLYKPLLWAPLALLGFPVEMMVLAMAFNLLYQYWLHTELLGDLGPLGWLLNSPSFHRVHHGRNPQYLDRNYAGIFILWDRIFGTFEPEREPVDYGVTVPVESDNPFVIATAEFRALGRDLRAARSLRGVLGHLFAQPGWAEDGDHKTARVARAEAEATRRGAPQA